MRPMLELRPSRGGVPSQQALLANVVAGENESLLVQTNVMGRNCVPISASEF